MSIVGGEFKMERWITATVDETYSGDEGEGIDSLIEGETIILYEDEKGNRTWEKIK